MTNIIKMRILSGYRATGKIHIGNLFGSLINWTKLQDKYECFFEIADWHALTTGYNNTRELKKYIVEMTKDWLACGISETKSTIFVQSSVKEHAELYLLFSMIVPVPWLERNPTLKEQIRDLHLQGKVNYGLLGYPVLQAADILIYKAEKVPVGEDQLAHLELSREIARRFNSLFSPIFPEPEPMLTASPRIPGIDGRKMSKSLGNSILVEDDEETIREKIMSAYTDPEKIYKGDKGHPDKSGCVVFAYHKIVSENWEGIKEDCISGKLGCVDCKKGASRNMAELLGPYRERRLNIKDERVCEILEDGSKKAQVFASQTLEEVRKAMNLW